MEQILFIIGNGFDLYHGFKTDYTNFKKYLKKNSSQYPLSSSFSIFEPFAGIDEDTWGNLECELAHIDFSTWASWYSSSLDVNLPDRDYDWEFKNNELLLEDFKEIRRRLLSALSCSLNDFIIEATEADCPPKEEFGKLFCSGKFITFNYSHILEDVYSIKKTRVFHIHGEARFRSVSKDDYEYWTLYDDASLIFGHGEMPISEDEDSENDIFNPHRVLDAISNDLRKSYKIEEFGNFVSSCNPWKIEIIGHGLGNVDFPYFKKLNELCLASTEIVYWLYDERKLENIKKALKNLFKNKKIYVRNYEGDVLFKRY